MATKVKPRTIKIKPKSMSGWNDAYCIDFAPKGSMDIVIKSHNNKKYLLSFNVAGDLAVTRLVK